MPTKNPREKSKDLIQEKDALLFGVRRSIRYHKHRVIFFDTVNRLAALFLAISGAATFIAILTKAPQFVSLALAIVVVVVSFLDLAVNTAYRARVYSGLTKRFYLLEQAILAEDNITRDALNQLKLVRLDIESSEPSTLKVLDSICHNEQLRAMGYDKEHFVEISWFQRLMANVMDVGGHKISNDCRDVE